jgi:Ca-activated chloride channel family protein
MKRAFQVIGEDLRSAYELAYHSKNPVNDGLFKKLVIRTKRPGLTIRTKTGYYARE